MPTPFDACGRDLLDVVPSVMRFIRAEMRSHREPGLSVAQFRALLQIGRNPNISLKEVADHLGLTAATTSTLVDGLVKRGFAKRTPSPNDRRRVILNLTSEGCTDMEDSERETQRALAAAIAHLSPEEVHAVRQSMTSLRRVFIAAALPERGIALLKASKAR